MGSHLKVKFWGTRGMISSPHKDTNKYGGNTSCIQIISENKLIIIDSGFGITNFGEELMKKIISEQENLSIEIFYTHFHWDHIQGLPFFHPIYFPTTSLNLYSPMSHEELHDNLDPLFDGSYSPFSGIKSMPSKIEFKQLKQEIEIGPIKVNFCPLYHGDCGHSYAYKFAHKEGSSIVVAVDHEANDSEINNKFIEFSKNCDLLIHDAQFTEEEYKDCSNWGHSSIKMALDNCLKINPRFTLLTHHSPYRKDAQIDSSYSKYSKISKYKDIEFEFAQELKIYTVNS